MRFGMHPGQVCSEVVDLCTSAHAPSPPWRLMWRVDKKEEREKSGSVPFSVQKKRKRGFSILKVFGP